MSVGVQSAPGAAAERPRAAGVERAVVTSSLGAAGTAHSSHLGTQPSGPQEALSGHGHGHGHGGDLGPPPRRTAAAPGGKGSSTPLLPLSAISQGRGAGAGTQPLTPLPAATQRCHRGGLKQAGHRSHPENIGKRRSYLLPVFLPEYRSPHSAAGTPGSASLLGEAKVSVGMRRTQAVGRELSGGQSSAPPNMPSLARFTQGLLSMTSLKHGLCTGPAPLACQCHVHLEPGYRTPVTTATARPRRPPARPRAAARQRGGPPAAPPTPTPPTPTETHAGRHPAGSVGRTDQLEPCQALGRSSGSWELHPKRVTRAELASHQACHQAYPRSERAGGRGSPLLRAQHSWLGHTPVRPLLCHGQLHACTAQLATARLPAHLPHPTVKT